MLMRYFVGVVAWVVFASCLLPGADAATNLSVLPLGGENSLYLGRADFESSLDKEVRIRINTDEGKQYQVYQRLEGSLVNERGEPLERSSITTGSLTGSNAFGTIYLQNADRLGFTDDLVYTSDQRGSNDSFTLIYKINPEEIGRSGNFTGRIIYTARVIGGGTQNQQALNVFLETADEFNISAESASRNNELAINTTDKLEDYVEISFNGNLNSNLKIFQEVIIPPRSVVNDEIDNELVRFVTSGGSNGNLYFQSSSAMGLKRELIYETDNAEDRFIVAWAINEDVSHQQKAGLYASKVRYIVMAGSKETYFDFDLNIESRPVFNLKVQYPPEGMKFNKLLPMDPPQIREVIVSVQTNLGRPYQVIQSVQNPLSNERGENLKDEAFMIKVEGEENGSITSKFIDFTPVPIGDVPIFSSGGQGSSAEFKVIYRMKPYPGMFPGNYRVGIFYSLGEI